ncbi:MAG TPA: NADH-dependent [FeFe] hydrogenase, group A6 [Spirochaetales bacterium]|nr:NADH-dependent [FeFe] hydrogenase, group A6 [Spirochaetales bacterium]HRY56103.1 NADH-dependent [FeFe] hydrogenase, group A6 [Spirochaetia bacterium]HRZ63513.1 NADH-dependent [FeFe] hydrogenase, group A6 [Spirochaetia bacterium]
MSEKMVTIHVDGASALVDSSLSLLEACAAVGSKVPTLCYLKDVSANASCGICVVEVEGAKSLVRSCVGKVSEGMKVRTSSPRVLRARRNAVELLLANHPADCLVCARNGSCELQAMTEALGLRQARFPRTRKAPAKDESTEGIVRDNDKCILCGRCVAVCSEVQSVAAIGFSGRGSRTRVATFLDRGLERSPCVQCGQCSVVCPTGAIVERDDTEAVWASLASPGRTTVVQTAPAIRASLGEALGMAPGSLVTGKMVAALRRLGFSKVFDTQFTADLTIMEEGSELIQRLTKGGKLPMITSCSPGWINFIETFYPSLLGHLSTCKSPQQMFGALAKSFYAERAGVDPAAMDVASIMPCTAKKHEAHRPEMRGAWEYWKAKGGAAAKGQGAYYDVDWALTTRELARMIRRAGIDIERLPEEDFDDPLGRSTGAATIFGTTGGVMEAALRTVYEIVVKKPLPSLDFTAVRGLEGIKSAEVDLAGTAVRVAVAHTLKNARALLDEIAAGKSPYHFIEVMTCPGGCVGGGGQPVNIDKDKRLARNKAMYAEDLRLGIRKSHENPAIKAIYADFLGEPLGHRSHELLHTDYVRREF